MALILDGKKARDSFTLELALRIKALGIPPALAIVQIGDREESNAYIRAKARYAEEVGARVRHVRMSEAATEEEIKTKIRELNEDRTLHGIIVQLPLPHSLSTSKIMECIRPEKDVDGLTSINIKHLMENAVNVGFVPATAKGISMLLSFYKIPIEGRHVVVVGRSLLVGKPVALTLLNQNATVTICHRKTERLMEITKTADILIVAVGVPEFISKAYVHPGQTVIDVGINVEPGKKLEEEIGGRVLVGDVNFNEVMPIVTAVSRVPGGVGPMTVAALFDNLVTSIERERSV